MSMRSIELFAGSGGLALGVSQAGFIHDALIEIDKHACETIRENQRRGVTLVSQWPLFECDVRLFDFSRFTGGIDILTGGPPCQPFSLGGKHRGWTDNRDMFPEAVRAVRELRPKAFLFENVKGLVRECFADYFEYILLQLTYPELVRRQEETWREHLTRLECHHTKGIRDGLSYRVSFRVLNAADYGVPQRRERVMIVGFREDLGIEWSFPEPTHSEEALLYSKWVSKEYWDRHGLPCPAPMPRRVQTRLQGMDGSTPRKPWLTVRDAISDLPDPSDDSEDYGIPNHRFVPGARAYPGHTGSVLDEPAKTLKAGDHGVPGGENMLVTPDGSLRYFTVRESCRLQTFPDDFCFPVSWTESMRQIGNAVPVVLARIVAESIRDRLLGA